MKRLGKYFLGAFALIAVAALGTAAWAFFTSSGAGAASAAVGDMAKPTNVQASSNGGAVTVTWADSAAPGGGAVDGYYVERMVGASASPACGSSPSSLVPSTNGPTCVDNSVSNGAYKYRVTAVWRSWTATSDESSVVTVTNDSAAPGATITFPGNNGVYNAGAFAAGCSTPGSDICGSATDTAGVAAVRVSILNQSLNKYWDGSGFTSSTEYFNNAAVSPLNGTSVTWSYALSSAPATSGYTVHVQAKDANNNQQTGTTYATAAAFTYDATAPTVTINQAQTPSAQNDPTNTSPVHFTATFSEPVTGFGDTAADVTLAGTGVTSSSTVSITGSGASYDVAVGNVTDNGTSGTVIVTVNAGAAADDASNQNTASTSTDNSVTYDATSPAVTISQADGQGDPTKTSPINFTVQFSETVTGFTSGDVTTSGPGSLTAVVSSLGSNAYKVAVAGMSSSTSGTVTIAIPASAAVDAAGNGSALPAFTDKNVFWDVTAPATTDNAPSAWQNASSVTVTLAATDNSAVATTWSTKDGSDPTSSSTRAAGNSVTVSAEGTNTIKYYSIDTVGNAESVKTATVKLDRSAPTGGAISVNGVAASEAGTTSYARATSVTINSRTDYAESATSSQSGLAASNLVRDDTSLTGDSCGSTWANGTTITGTTTQTGLSSGRCYRFRLTGTDTAGNSATISTVVKLDAQAPTGSFTAPASAATVSGDVVVSATASDALTAVASVQFKAGTSNIGVADTSSPYSVAWDSTTSANGSVALTADITDTAGNVFTIPARSVTVLNQFTVTLSAVGNKTAGAAFGVEITAKDHLGNTVTSYTGTKTLQFSGPSDGVDGTPPNYPASVTFINGVASNVGVKLYRAETKTLTVKDANRTGTSGNITVVAGAVAKLAWNSVSSPDGATVGTPCLFSCTITAANNKSVTGRVSATDTYGNVISDIGAPRSVTVAVSAPAGSQAGSFQPLGTSVTVTLPGSGAATSETFTYKAPNGSWTSTTVTATVAGTAWTSATMSVQK